MSKRKSKEWLLATNHKGFTLLEVLVSVTIIAILAVVVLVSLRPMLHAANRAGSLGTLRQVGAAASAYRAENHGRLPPRGADTAPFKTFIRYFRDAGYTAEKTVYLSPAARNRPPKSKDIMGSVNRPWFFSATDQSSYGLNYALSRHINGGPGTHPGAFGVLMQSDTLPSASIPMFVDCVWPGFGATSSEWDAGRIPFGRYGDKLTVFFLNGSAASVGEDRIRDLIWTKADLTK